ncbi:MAG: hypothetical protein H0U15_07155 [Geodermatophilaceae bacterium]|nr:hypothetical protein [Geodermatophilaceae bacterium]
MTGRVDREVGGVFDELLRGGSFGELDGTAAALLDGGSLFCGGRDGGPCTSPG